MMCACCLSFLEDIRVLEIFCQKCWAQQCSAEAHTCLCNDKCRQLHECVCVHPHYLLCAEFSSTVVNLYANKTDCFLASDVFCNVMAISRGETWGVECSNQILMCEWTGVQDICLNTWLVMAVLLPSWCLPWVNLSGRVCKFQKRIRQCSMI